MILFLAFACSSPAPVAGPGSQAVAPAAAPVTEAHSAAAHSHTAAHGGVVQVVGDMHVEAVMSAGGVLFYLSDDDQKPLSVDGYAGTAVVKAPDGVHTVTLMAMGDHLHAAVPLEVGKPASAVLTLTAGGKADSVAFDVAAVGTPPAGLAAHDHTSLHGGQVGMWGDFHLEYLAKDDVYSVWVSDAHRVAITTGVSGTLTDAATVVPLTFDPATGLLSGKGAGAGSRPVSVDVKVGDAAFTLAFPSNKL